MKRYIWRADLQNRILNPQFSIVEIPNAPAAADPIRISEILGKSAIGNRHAASVKNTATPTVSVIATEGAIANRQSSVIGDPAAETG